VAARDRQPDAREGQAGPSGVAESVPMIRRAAGLGGLLGGASGDHRPTPARVPATKDSRAWLAAGIVRSPLPTMTAGTGSALARKGAERFRQET
jgi:hypothetical protein